MMHRVFALVVFCIGVAACGSTGPAHPTADELVDLDSTRDELVLNGSWAFAPAVDEDASELPAKGETWGTIRVPGAWANKAWWTQPPGVEEPGKGPGWESLNELSRAWYRRRVEIPAEWAERTITLDLQRVSTDAVAFIDGKRVGEVTWPEGQIDLTGHVQPGGTHELSLFVLATTDSDQVVRLMETASAQVSMEKAKLSARGLIGDVILHSRPVGTHISDIFVKPSVRQRKLGVEVELRDVEKAGPTALIVQAVGPQGQIEKQFIKEVELRPGEVQRLSAEWPWKDATLWELGKPHLYDLRVGLRGSGLDDVTSQRFGFREFWIEGRNFYLNGLKVHLRPTLLFGTGMREVDEARIESAMKAGFNFVEHWPSDHFRRGYVHYREHFARVADEKGLLVAGSIGYMPEFIYDWGAKKRLWNTPEGKAAFEERVAKEIRRWRNHPSIVTWASSGNFFGHELDQDPRHIGRTSWVPEDEELWHYNAEAGAEGISIIKGLDPTRPVFTHHGAYVGDVHTLNMYLNMLPLQDREEWLSAYAEKGELPFAAVEFGTPVNLTARRYRDNHAGADKSEPWVTEFAATYLGAEAYRLEDDKYRKGIAKFFDPEKNHWEYRWPRPEEHAAFQQLLELYITNTWRSWRTWGMPGGMIPWIDGHGWEHASDSRDKVSMPAFEAGRRGTYLAAVEKAKLYPYDERGRKVTKAGHALMASNGPTLAWLAGRTERFTAKDHNFRSGSKVEKQLVLLNDTRDQAAYAAQVTAKVGGKQIYSQTFKGSLEPGQSRRLPLVMEMPKVGVKTDGQLQMRAKVAGRPHQDSFALRVFPKSKGKPRQLYAIDPRGDTSKLLKGLGHRVKKWDGSAHDLPIVIGRHALSSGKVKLAELEEHVLAGATVLVMSQDPEWVERYTGFRLARHIARRVFPIDTDHQVVRGLDAEDLRDWSGESKVVEPRPKYIPGEFEVGSSGIPYAGWRWGGYGGVSTGALEKPHQSGWRPILECEFDLAYTPLLELDHGNGRLIWSALDLEDHYLADPAAERLASNLIDYTHASSLREQPEPVEVVYAGDAEGRKLLDRIGLTYRRVRGAPPTGALLVLGDGARLLNATLERHLQRGGNVLVLPRGEGAAPLGAAIQKRAEFSGSLNPPSWPEARGLSASDLRFRSDHDAYLVTDAGGVEVAADGLLGRKKVGPGVILYVQVDPTLLPADQRPYFRFTRWRQTRALSQLLVNLGSAFESDSRVFRHEGPAANIVSLARIWKGKFTLPLEPLEKGSAHPDPGLSADAKKLLRMDANEKDLLEIHLPAAIEKLAEGSSAEDGEVVVRTWVDVPEALAEREAELSLGPVDDFDQTYVNGKLVGSTDKATPTFWAHPRVYHLPKGTLKPGRNLIAVRVFDHMGGGGFFGSERQLSIRPLATEEDARRSLYHPDYITDFVSGDDPYRYKRW